jgi:hypothetical protein
MKKKLPKMVNILGHNIPIKLVAECELEPENAAEFCPVEQSIKIMKTLPVEVQWRLLFHEIRHVHQFHSGLMQILDRQALEMDCDSFASIIISLKQQKII